jgi:hypothetical protein
MSGRDAVGAAVRLLKGRNFTHVFRRIEGVNGLITSLQLPLRFAQGNGLDPSHKSVLLKQKR